MNVMPRNIFFSQNVTAITIKFTKIIHALFAIMKLFFLKVFIIFDTLLPTLNKTLYTNVVKFPASTLEYIMNSTRKL
jgi:hypothetical protein